MFDISEKLISEQSDEIYGVNTIKWVILHGNILSLIGDEEVISLSHAKVYVFSDSVLCFGKMSENPPSNTFWEDKLTWFKSSSQHRTVDTIDGEPMEFEWNIFQGFTSLQLVQEVRKFMSKMGEPEQFQGRIIFVSMFNDIIWRYKDDETECIANSTLCVSIRIQISSRRVAEVMMIKFCESGHPVFRGTSHLSRGTLKSKVSENYQYTSVRWRYCSNLFFAQLFLLISSVFTEQSQICVRKYEAFHVRTVRLVLAGQSDPLFGQQVC